MMIASWTPSPWNRILQISITSPVTRPLLYRTSPNPWRKSIVAVRDVLTQLHSDSVGY